MRKDNWPTPYCRRPGALFCASLCLLLLCSIGLIATPAIAATEKEDRPLVAAASSLRLAWPSLMAAWEGSSARVSFGASGTLAQQIRNGAPFELFLSADGASIDLIVRAGLALKPPEIYAKGTLVLVFERNSGTADASQDLASQLDQLLATDDARLSIANPVHAPYGRAARALLRSIDREESTSHQWVIGENAAQALHFVQLGAARAGLIPASLASAIDQKRFAIVPIDPDLHEDVLHHMILLKGASEAASRLYDWLLSEPARQSFHAYGLTGPR